jgi:hypothetical protein
MMSRGEVSSFKWFSFKRRKEIEDAVSSRSVGILPTFSIPRSGDAARGADTFRRFTAMPQRSQRDAEGKRYWKLGIGGDEEAASSDRDLTPKGPLANAWSMERHLIKGSAGILPLERLRR